MIETLKSMRIVFISWIFLYIRRIDHAAFGRVFDFALGNVTILGIRFVNMGTGRRSREILCDKKKIKCS